MPFAGNPLVWLSNLGSGPNLQASGETVAFGALFPASPIGYQMQSVSITGSGYAEYPLLPFVASANAFLVSLWSSSFAELQDTGGTAAPFSFEYTISGGSSVTFGAEENPTTGGTLIDYVTVPVSAPKMLNHFCMSFDTVSGQVQLYVNGQPVSVPWVAGASYPGAMGGNPNATFGVNGNDLADLYINPLASFYDLSIPSNLAKFITPAGNPVSLGSNGQTPTGSIPLAFHSFGQDNSAIIGQQSNRPQGVSMGGSRYSLVGGGSPLPYRGPTQAGQIDNTVGPCVDCYPTASGSR
jgi:hypothetical protein